MKSVSTAYKWWLGWIFGLGGLHRFYMGKIGTGILWTLTWGFGGIGIIYDALTMSKQIREVNTQLRLEQRLEEEEYYGFERPRRNRHEAERHYVGHDSQQHSMEHIIFKMAKNNRGIVSPAQLALDANITADNAKAELDDLLSKGYAELRVKQTGVIVYAFPEFLDPGLDEELSNLS